MILERFIKNEFFGEALALSQNEIGGFVDKCRQAKIPELNKPWSFRETVQNALQCVSLSFGNVKHSEEGTASYSLLSVTPTKSVGSPAEPAQQSAPMFLHDIHEALVVVLKKADLKLWIMLDRLDEVFPRRTKLEQIALRALLRTTRNFPTEMIRIKLFLRDDIFENVLLGIEGFTALSHVEARRAPSLRWGISEIKLMIVKRFSANPRLRHFCKVDKARVEQNDMEHANEIFDTIFPPQVVPGKNQSSTTDWIYHHCEDGRAAVTPCDVIDLLEFAIKAQVDQLQRGVDPGGHLISGVALKEAHNELSKKKCRTYLEAEFPGFWRDIKRFENAKAEHNEKSLQQLLGPKWSEKTEDLVGLGFLSKRPGGSYIIPFLFRAGMGIRQGKAF